MKVAILTSKNQWFEEYAPQLASELNNAPIYYDHHLIDEAYDILFILSYHRIIESHYLDKNKHNIVVHESDLPLGKGWAPLFWQVLEGKDEIIFSLFEAGSGIDNGDIYLKKTLHLTGYELNLELRERQANLTIQMCREFLIDYEKLSTPTKQSGQESFYPKRSPKDSKLDIDLTIRQQFNLLRIANNEDYPAFFEIDGIKYLIKIEKA